MQPAIAAVPCLWSLDVEKTVNTLIALKQFQDNVGIISTADVLMVAVMLRYLTYDHR